MSVSGSAGSFGATDYSGSGDIEGLASWVAMAVCLECSAEVAFGVHHPSLLHCFYRWCNSVPIHTSLLLVLLLHWELLVLGSAVLFLWGV